MSNMHLRVGGYYRYRCCQIAIPTVLLITAHDSQLSGGASRTVASPHCTTHSEAGHTST